MDSFWQLGIKAYESVVLYQPVQFEFPFKWGNIKDVDMFEMICILVSN